MATDLQPAAKPETGQVLAVELVDGHEPTAQRSEEAVAQLRRAIEQTDAFRGAHVTGKVRRVDTPKGLALIFTSTPDAPVRCAVQMAKALGNKNEPGVRMGIDRGPVFDSIDTDEEVKTTGAGFERAFQIMQCGDAGHILLSRDLAASLAMYRHWQPHLEHLGEYQAQNGELLSVVNLCTGEVGRSDVPARLADLPVPEIPGRHRPFAIGKHMSLLAGAVVVAGFAAFFVAQSKRTTSNSDGASPIPEKSIAVLPFENISGTPETATFTDAIQDEILTDLANLADLKVISRTSVLQYRSPKTRNLRDIARQLGVAHVLEGSVQKVGDHVRVTAQLIDARKDSHLWAQTYDRVLTDVFAIQTDIAKTISEQLKVQLSPREREALAQTATNDLVADRLFREAIQHLTSGSNPDAKQSLLDSIPLLEEALERDPNFMRAYSLLVTAHLDLYWQGFDHSPERAEAARRVIDRATAAGPNSGETHYARALYQYRVFRDYDRARAELDTARQLLPNNAGIYIILGAMDRRQGRWPEALEHLNHGIELDPRNFRFLVEAGFTAQAMRLYDEAAALYRRAVNVQPRDAFARTQLGAIPFYEHGDLASLHQTIAQILQEDPSAATSIAGAIFNCALAERNRAGVTRALQAMRAEGLRDDYNNSLWPRDWFVGLAAQTFGDAAAARTAFAAAREIELKNVKAQPDYAPAWSRLGLIEAALGQKEEALQAARKACELLPMRVDAVDGSSYRINLAIVYLWTGDRESALHELEQVAQFPGGGTYGELRLYPYWDSLRGDPRFERIITSLTPNGSNIR
jgi:TolB-like protein/Flp pilus assembly protein TadD